MDLKKILKTIKVHEQQISMIFGVIILLLAAVFVIKYVKNLKNDTTINETAASQDSTQTHIITKGETLWSIAENYYQQGSDWKMIANANNITDPIKLEVGQKITIPSISTIPSSSPQATETVTLSPVPVAPTATPTPQITKEAASTTSDISTTNYTVIKGDTLWKIAVRAYGNGYKWIEIARANHLHNPNVIHTGNVFVLPR